GGPVGSARSWPSPRLPSGGRISELFAGDCAHLAVALGQVLPPPGDLGSVDHAGLQLVEVRQVYMGRRGVTGLPSDGRQEPGPGRGAQEESHGEEDASHPSPPPTTAISLTATSASCSQAMALTAAENRRRSSSSSIRAPSSTWSPTWTMTARCCASCSATQRPISRPSTTPCVRSASASTISSQDLISTSSASAW